jgi:hypothetical protein
MRQNPAFRRGKVAQETTVEKAIGKQGVKEFIRFPWKIYKDEPLWVPPLIKEQMVMFSPQYPFFEHGEMELFLARRSHETVGRVAAILDKSYVDLSQNKSVFFGFFKSIDDSEVARAPEQNSRGTSDCPRYL